MQGINFLVVSVVVVALFGLVFAAPAPAEELSGVEQMPAMLVRSGPAQLSAPEARQCTNSQCASLCRSLGWSTGVCLDAEWCLCHN